MLQLFHFDVAKVDRGMLHMLHILQVFQRHVASVYSKCFIYFQTYVASILIRILHMFHIYVRNVSAISVLCCGKCFHVCKLQVFYLDVANVSHI